MMEKSSSQYDSFLFWRQPLPALDMSELEDLGLADSRLKPKDKTSQLWSEDSEVRRSFTLRTWLHDVKSCLLFVVPLCVVAAGAAVRVLLLQLLESSNRRRGLPAGGPQPAALKPPRSKPGSDPRPFVHADKNLYPDPSYSIWSLWLNSALHKHWSSIFASGVKKWFSPICLTVK